MVVFTIVNVILFFSDINQMIINMNVSDTETKMTLLKKFSNVSVLMKIIN